MAARRLPHLSRIRFVAQPPSACLIRSHRPQLSFISLTSQARCLTYSPLLHQSNPPPAPNPSAAAQSPDPRTAPPPSQPDSSNPDTDSTRFASFLGESDSNDAHEANRDAIDPPPPSLDAANSAYLGEADSDNGFETQRDLEGRAEHPVDATHSAFLGEADSDDGFEGRRAVHPEEGDHGLEDVSGSGSHGEIGEGGDVLEQDGGRVR